MDKSTSLIGIVEGAANPDFTKREEMGYLLVVRHRDLNKAPYCRVVLQ
jgi:hypothetical protein